jgi:hypothetical protein
MLKWIFIFLSIFSILVAEDIDYSFNLSSKTPYKNEAILLDVNLTQLNHSSVMFFKFTPKKSSNYDFKQIDFIEKEKYHALKHEYRYIIYPLKDGNISIEFDMIKSITTDDSVAYAISGDRDNIKGLVKKDVEVELKPLILDVKPLPKNTNLVGNFKINYKLDKNITKSYEPIYLHIEIEGSGYLKGFDILSKSKEYNIFAQKPKVSKNSIEWDYALSSKDNFTLPKIDLKVFNPKNKKSYNLIIPSQNIEVQKIDSNSLLDKEDNPPLANQDIDWSWIGWLFSYIAVFVAGFLTPREIFRKRLKERSIEDKIASAKSHRELLKILLSLNNIKYKRAIESLESVIYSGKKIALKEIKKLI